MKGPWKVTSNIINDVRMYAVCRMLDTCATDHSGNREYRGEYYRHRPTAERLAEELNRQEENL